MPTYRRVDVQQVDDVTVVKFVDPKVLDEDSIQQLGQELYRLADQPGGPVILNFASVEFFASAAFAKLITMDKKAKNNSRRVMLTNIRPEIYEAFAIKKLNKLFEIKDDEADALSVLQDES